MLHSVRLAPFGFLVVLGLGVCFTTQATLAESPNTLSEQEREQGFRLLFDGRTLAGWQHKGNWKVDKGVITRSGRGGSLVYTVK